MRSDGPDDDPDSNQGVQGFWVRSDGPDGAYSHGFSLYEGAEAMWFTLSDQSIAYDDPDGDWPAGALNAGVAVQGTLQIYEGSDPISVSASCTTGADAFPNADPEDLSIWALYDGAATLSAGDGGVHLELDAVFIDPDGATTDRSIDATFNLCGG